MSLKTENETRVEGELTRHVCLHNEVLKAFSTIAKHYKEPGLDLLTQCMHKTIQVKI